MRINLQDDFLIFMLFQPENPRRGSSCRNKPLAINGFLLYTICMDQKRLSKALAGAGVASRRACEEMIFEGRVTVNGTTVNTPQTLVDWDSDRISVDGTPITGEQVKVYLILNKPPGYLCSRVRRGQKDKLVFDLVPDSQNRLFTVGRLDKDTSGLLLLTNDGDFANQLMHPRYGITKEYLVKVDGDISHEDLVALSEGAMVEGSLVKPKKVVKVRRGTLKITVAEGKKHEVRLLITSIGFKVLQLSRIRIGSLTLGNLALGNYRTLKEKELAQFTE